MPCRARLDRVVLPCLVLLALTLAACGRKAVRSGDGLPDRQVPASSISEAVPGPEALSRYGNHSPYSVFGRTYHVLSTARGYRERGYASWYGRKFHGRRTSSGEPFDVYKATAAHRTLPLPTYAEVTNLENGRKITVKINDRGPFKDGRIIDLSYGAALKLGMVDAGTARVEVRAITFERTGGGGSTGQWADIDFSDGTFLQAGAFSSDSAARTLRTRLVEAGIRPVTVQAGELSDRRIYRVWVGPLGSDREVRQVTREILELGLERPHRVKR